MGCRDGRSEGEASRHDDDLEHADDVALLSMAIEGDAAAENLVFDHLRRRMLAAARQALHTADVEDIVQDVLVVVYSKYPDLVARARLEDDAGLERWWRRILYHRIGNDIRRRRFECGHCVPAEQLSVLASTDAPDSGCAAAELRDVALRAIRRLTSSQRALLTRRGEPVEHGPTGRASRNARYAKLYRIRKALREAMRDAGFLKAGMLCVVVALFG